MSYFTDDLGTQPSAPHRAGLGRDDQHTAPVVWIGKAPNKAKQREAIGSPCNGWLIYAEVRCQIPDRPGPLGRVAQQQDGELAQREVRTVCADQIRYLLE